MMKLLRAEIKNFRLLKELVLDFSVDNDKPLTVIRAANESGKTTCEYALMWGFWGENGLPEKYHNFQIQPADILNDKNLNTEVTIDFLVENFNDLPKKYRLTRQYFVGTPSRDHLTIFEIKNTGSYRLQDTEAKKLIDSILPLTLKDVYFTDGDRALSFIESSSTATTKKKRVYNAIRALLSLDVLESTIRHLSTVSDKFNSEVDNTDYVEKVENINDKIISCREDIDEWKEELDSLEKERKDLEYNKNVTNSKIGEIVAKGDKKYLIEQKEQIERELFKLSTGKDGILKELRGLVQNENLGLIMLGDQFKQAKNYLSGLEGRKQLPKVNIPILEELLTKSVCFCGADLDESSEIGKQHREHIHQAIEDSYQSDRITELATALYFSVRSKNSESASSDWENDYQEKMKQYMNISSLLSTKESRVEQLQIQINAIKDDSLEVFKMQYKKYDDRLMVVIRDIGGYETKISNTEDKLNDLEREKQKYESRLNKEDKITQKIHLTNALKFGFQEILTKLKNEEIEKVSKEMNRIFLEMVGSVSSENDFSSITRAELSSDCEIKVYGLGNKLINPDQDLNGASRRAITLAFILALTKVSQVEAPNVIDTPLGMMSGYVKQSVLNQMIKEGSQTILFLTHDEITGVQHLIDKYAGVIFTLTNPAHYPLILKNKPSTDDARILRCECNHYQYCEVCERNEILKEI